MAAKVISFEELCTQFETKTGKNVDDFLNEFIRQCPREMDIQDSCLNFVNELCGILNVEGPAYIIGFLPPYCPSRVNQRQSAAELKSVAVVQKLIEARKKENIQIELSEVYEGISDLSELGFQGDNQDIELLEKNLVGLNATTSYSFQEMQQLDIPVVNIGPIGKDAHKLGERLYLPYFKEVLPKLLLDFIEEMQA